MKTNQTTLSLSMKEQLINISRKIPNLLDSSVSSNEQILKIAFSLDGISLSDDTEVHLYPVNVFICNIKNNDLKNKLVIHKTFTLIKAEQEIDYELMLTPFIEEANELSNNSFPTEWSQNTKLRAKCFLADAPCRHAALGVMSHSGQYPCFKCVVQKKQKKRPNAAFKVYRCI